MALTSRVMGGAYGWVVGRQDDKFTGAAKNGHHKVIDCLFLSFSLQQTILCIGNKG